MISIKISAIICYYEIYLSFHIHIHIILVPIEITTELKSLIPRMYSIFELLHHLCIWNGANTYVYLLIKTGLLGYLV